MQRTRWQTRYIKGGLDGVEQLPCLSSWCHELEFESKYVEVATSQRNAKCNGKDVVVFAF